MSPTDGDKLLYFFLAAAAVPVLIYVQKMLIQYYFGLKQMRETMDRQTKLLERIADTLAPEKSIEKLVVDPDKEESVNDPEVLKRLTKE